MKMYELVPTNGAKSFYGKAKVYEFENSDTVLYSYNTPVCKITKQGRFIRLWSGYSLTTMNHIKAFCANFGISNGGKAWWQSLPIEK